MAKSKLSMKDLFLKKGEFIALGVAGTGLVVLLLWGVMTGLGAEDPDKISKDLVQKSQSIQSSLSRPDPDDPGAAVPPLEDWVRKEMSYAKVDPRDFQVYGPFFDPTAKPETKRENPNVLGIRNFQVDLVRAPMKAYDITYDDPPKIAVRVTKEKRKFDVKEIRDVAKQLKTKGKAGRDRYGNAKKKKQAPKQPQFPGGMGPGFPGDGGDMGSPDGLGFGPEGMEGMGGFDQAAQRTETAITYVPLESVDQAIAEGKTPAMSVVPLRMVVINAEFPFKEQLEEVKRAMRLRDYRQAYPYVRFDGFNVKRQVSYTRSNGEVTIVQPWADYNYVDKYIELIDARKLADHFEGADPSRPREAWLPYFYRYEDAMVMPLPELVPDLGKYPEIKLPSINATIDKLIDASTEEIKPSDLAQRLAKMKPQGGNRELFKPRTSKATGGNAFFGADSFSGPDIESMKMGPGGMGNEGMPAMPQVDIEHLLLRFIDCDVKPGFTYEYQIQVKMINPNYGYPKMMANPRLATEERYKVLLGQWVQLRGALTVPTESFLYAYDSVRYRNEIDAEYGTSELRELYHRLQARPDQAVVQAATWLEEVRTEASNQREPIGGWVLAEMPVDRGAYIGKKTYVKLPLWSSELNQYVLREMPANSVVRGKAQPKGWLVDFSSRAILVDFEGGKTRTKAGIRTIEEEVATEMLIIRPDGKMEVRNSDTDMADPTRTRLADEWKKWIENVETRKLPTGMGSENPFERPPGSP